MVQSIEDSYISKIRRLEYLQLYNLKKKSNLNPIY